MTFERTCGPCSGRGYYGINPQATCKACGGSGALVFEGEPRQYRTCGPCSGRGYYGVNPQATCKVCGGSGVIMLQGDPRQYRTCGPCSGRGYYGINPEATCEACGGRGVVKPKKVNTGAAASRMAAPKGRSTETRLFIAHASEDKGFVTPLAKALVSRGLQVWYDDFVLKAGDSLRREIDRGLAQCDYGVVVLSHPFFQKHHPQKELDGLAAREGLDKKVIVPIWHHITRDEVEAYSPTMADIVAIRSGQSVERVVEAIIKAIS